MHSFPSSEPVHCSMSSCNCCFLPCIHISSGGRWSGIPSLRIFQFFVIHTVKGFSVVNEAEVDVLLELSCFLYGPVDVGSLISPSSLFCKSSLNFWEFSVHILVKPSLTNFEHNPASMWNECNCTVGWTFFGISFHRDWNENRPLPVLWSLLIFFKCMDVLSAALYSIIF